MQNCFREHPEEYAAELGDEEDDEVEDREYVNDGKVPEHDIRSRIQPEVTTSDAAASKDDLEAAAESSDSNIRASSGPSIPSTQNPKPVQGIQSTQLPTKV